MSTKSTHAPFSLVTRLTFFISLATISAFFIFAWIIIRSINGHFAEQDINDLKQISSTLEKVLDHPDEPESRRLEILKNVVAGYSNVIVTLENAQQQIIFNSPNAPDIKQLIGKSNSAAIDKNEVLLLTSSAVLMTGHNDELWEHTSWRVICLPVGKQADGRPEYTLYMALSIDFHLHYLNALKYNLITAAVVTSLLIIFIVLFAVYKGHEPLRSVSQRIQSITSKDLDVRLDPTTVPIELEQLATSFNHMIERIEDVFTRQSNFSADLAHEMRTPITNLVTQTEIVLSQPRTQKELEEVLYSNLEELSRLSKMISDMLFLAQADNHQLIPEKKSLKLADEVQKVFDFFEAWAEESEVTLHLEGQDLWVLADPIMLRRVISNLLSNAMHYTARGQTVTVEIKEEHGQVQLTVANPGSAIPSEHLPKLFDRLYRVDPARQRKTDGSGIGLAIVKSIIIAHGGNVSVASDEHSTRFSLILPKQGYES